jgi:predicted dienelactone hydrolase
MRAPKSLLLCGALLAGLNACGSDDTTDPPVEPSPPDPPPAPSPDELFARGDFAVGFRETELTYDPVGPDDSRTLLARVWYPAVDGGEEAATYSVAGIVSLPTPGALTEPAAAEGGPFPLAIYSHGSGGEGLLAYPYAELFASHGWVMVSLNHAGNTAIDGLMGTGAPFAANAINRPLDISAALDWVEDDFAGELVGVSANTDEVFLFGHSFGAYTTFAAGGVDLDVSTLEDGCSPEGCELLADPEVQAAFEDLGDARIAAIAPQAPALVSDYVEGELAALGVPTMLQSGRKDITTTDATQAQPAWAGLDHPDDIWIELPDGGHLSFISVCDDLEGVFLSSFQPGNETDGCGEDFVPVAQSVPALAAYLLGFARQHILGETAWAEVLAGEPLDPAVVVTTR